MELTAFQILTIACPSPFQSEGASVSRYTPRAIALSGNHRSLFRLSGSESYTIFLKYNPWYLYPHYTFHGFNLQHIFPNKFQHQLT